MIRRPKTLLFLTFLIVSLEFATCASPPAPQGAIEELNDRWQSLPGSQTHDLVVLRAWQGKFTHDTDKFLTSMEIWCFETQAAPKFDLPQGSERMVWVVTRPSGNGAWEASPLMIFSSTWPYEACLGSAPWRTENASMAHAPAGPVGATGMGGWETQDHSSSSRKFRIVSR